MHQQNRIKSMELGNLDRTYIEKRTIKKNYIRKIHKYKRKAQKPCQLTNILLFL